MTKWEVYCIDWSQPNEVDGPFDTKEEAEKVAERMDGLALRCSVRPIHDDPTAGERD